MLRVQNFQSNWQKEAAETTCLPGFFTGMIYHHGLVSDVVILLTWNLDRETNGGCTRTRIDFLLNRSNSAIIKFKSTHSTQNPSISPVSPNSFYLVCFSHLDLFQTFLAPTCCCQILVFQGFVGCQHVDSPCWCHKIIGFATDARCKIEAPWTGC